MITLLIVAMFFIYVMDNFTYKIGCANIAKVCHPRKPHALVDEPKI